MSGLYRYAAFISYSSKDKDFAERLHRFLESFSIPSSLGNFDLIGDGKKNRIFPVFRDKDELTTGDLSESLQAALRASRCLIVICSERCQRSAWVNKEVEYFKGLDRGDVIFPIIAPDVSETLEGEALLKAVFPPSLDINGAYLLAGDARPGVDGFKGAALKIIAGMLEVDLGTLTERYKKRRRELRMHIGALTAAVALAFGALGVASYRSTQNEAADSLLTASREAYQNAEYEHAAKLALLATRPKPLLAQIPGGALQIMKSGLMHTAVFEMPESRQTAVDAAFIGGAGDFLTLSDQGGLDHWSLTGDVWRESAIDVAAPVRAIHAPEDGPAVFLAEDAASDLWLFENGPDGWARTRLNQGAVAKAVLGPNATIIAMLLRNGELAIIDRSSGQPATRTISAGSPAGFEASSQLVISQDSQAVFVINDPSRVCVVDLAVEREDCRFLDLAFTQYDEAGSQQIDAFLAISPNGPLFVGYGGGPNDHYSVRWDLENDRWRDVLLHGGGIGRIATCHDVERCGVIIEHYNAVTLNNYRTLERWVGADIDNGPSLATSIAVAPRRAAILTANGAVSLWSSRASSGAFSAARYGYAPDHVFSMTMGGFPEQVAVSRSGLVLVRSDVGEIVVFDAARPDAPAYFEGPNTILTRVFANARADVDALAPDLASDEFPFAAVTHDHRRMVLGGRRSTVRVATRRQDGAWSYEDLPGPPGQVQALDIASHGERFIAAGHDVVSTDNLAWVYTRKSSGDWRRNRLEGHMDTVTAVGLSEDGRFAVTMDRDREIRVWTEDRSGRWYGLATPSTSALDGPGSFSVDLLEPEPSQLLGDPAPIARARMCAYLTAGEIHESTGEIHRPLVRLTEADMARTPLLSALGHRAGDQIC